VSNGNVLGRGRDARPRRKPGPGSELAWDSRCHFAKRSVLSAAASGDVSAVVMAALALLVLGCGGSPPPSPKPQPCGYLGDSCTAKTPCCRSVNGAPIECFDGACEYK